MEKQPLLEIAEYVSLAGSVLGTVAAVASQQVVYAAAPLTVALSLNLVNRRRFPQQIQQDTIGAITETHQVIQSLHQQVQALPSINSKLNALSQEFTARPETQTIEQLETAIAQLTQQWEALTLRLDNLPTASEVNLTGQDQAIADINAQLDALRLRLEHLPTTSEIDLTGVVEAIAGQLDALSQQFNTRSETQAIEQLETAIAQLTQQQLAVASRLENLPPTSEVDLTGQEQLFADINAQLDTLRLRLENLPTASEVDLSGVEQAITSINGQLDALSQQFNARPETQAIEQLETAIAQLTQQQLAVALRLENLPTPSEVDLTGQEQAIADINAQLDALRLRLEHLSTTSEIDLTGVVEAIAGQLDALSQQFNARPETQTIEQLESAIAQLRQQQQAVALRLENLPPTSEVDLSGVVEAITDINGQLDALSQQFNARPETQAIEQLETAIAQLTQQQLAVALRLENLPTPSEVDLTGQEQAIADINDQLDALRLRLDHLPTPSDVDLSGVVEAIGGQLDALSQQFNARPETQTIEQLESAIAQLRQQQQAVALRLENLPTTSEVDLSGVVEAITDINGQLDALSQQFNARPETQTIEQLETAIAQLTQQQQAVALRLENLPTTSEVDLTGVVEAITDINDQLDALRLRLDHLPTASDVDLSGVVEAITDINSQLDALNQQFNERPETQAIEQLESAIAQLRQQQQAVALRFENLPTASEVDLTGVEQAIDSINSQLDALNQQFNERPETQAIEQLEATIAQLRQQQQAVALRFENLPTASEVDLTGVEQAIDSINSQLDALNQQFNERPETQALEQLESAIAQLRQQQQAVALRFENLPTASEVDLTGVEQAIDSINSQLDTLNQQFNERPETQAIEQLEATIAQLRQQQQAVVLRFENLPTASEVDLTGVEQAIDSINSQLDTLNQQFNERPETQALEQLEATIAQLRQQQQAVVLRFENLPTASEVDLTGVEQAIDSINSQLDALNQQFNERPETQALEQLETTIAQLRQQQQAVALRFENLPTASEVDLTGVEQAIASINEQLDTLRLRLDHPPTTSEVDLSGIEEAIIDIYVQLDGLTGRLDNVSTPSGADLSGVEAAIAPSDVQQDALTLPVDYLLTPPEVDLSGVEAAIAPSDVQQDALTLPVDNLPTPSAVELTAEEREIQDINRQLDALNQQFKARPETQAIQQLESAIAQLAQQLNAITLRLRNLPTTPEVDLSGVRQAITDINNQLDALNQQLKARPETEIIDQLDTAIIQLKEQLNALALNLDNLPTPLEEAITDMNFQLQAMALCLDTLPAPLEVDFSGVGKAVTDINVQLDALTLSLSENPPARAKAGSSGGNKALEQLERAITQLKNQLNTVAFILDSAPTFSDLDFNSEEPSIADLQW